MANVLDNPVWEALGSRQQHLNIGNGKVKFFPADVAPFIGVEHWDERSWPALLNMMPAGRSFSVLVSDAFILPKGVQLTFSLPLYQLVCNNFKPFDQAATQPKILGREHIPQMLSLTAATKPGPFFERTIDLGSYLGIFEGDDLLAMAGERLKMNGYTEASAICTKPGHGGKGYASCLLSAISAIIIAAGETPFLHVKQDNEPALAVYKKLGFEIRRATYFAVFKKE